MPAFIRITWKVVFDALWHFSLDDGWAMASHVALSSLLAVFPFLIFGTALGSFLGADQFAETAVHLIFDAWPESIATPIANEIVQVLTIPRGGLLTVSVLAAAYFASNGVEALRVSLNRAYRVTESRYWYVTRLASLGFVIAGVLILAALSILLVAVPLALRYAGEWLPWLDGVLATVDNWSLPLALVVVTGGLLVSHLWLPDGHRKVIDVLPGIFLTLLCWTIGGYTFAYYLSTFATYVSTYAGLASIMIVLVFLYMVAAIFIIGAEINAAILKYRVKRMVRRSFQSPRTTED
ncbi:MULTISPECIES: YihY/virulence factor BrkB family protein [Ensifer]|jgi:membrane protein|uniref:YihY family inner membrane protein n=1 Tax=Ensifer canadensis TaxID=555315 RepID=A0AAW4FVA1_9HYPH|nr:MULTISPECIES: YihY/virulence factor BrkB family protein [Ensifer]MDP9634793.1 membrane protein [Ensifer adhaerens]KQU81757.1 ribonuclease BN [Ensifer sp. Root31]KQW48297.1 ribonuclease BN [Ensifer sp. Root1252]KQW66071.1 ribonuclease BN [Ensifer sp. Root127]KQY66288.1 ribonuclease BN [Ensifer sp. Root142]